jgi:hypothetical protein
LKIVGELAGKMAGFGAVGVIGFGMKKVADGFRDAAKEAYNLETHAQNTAMSTKEFSALSGALRILGTDSETAAASIESVFKSLNEAASGSNATVVGAMEQIGAQIIKNKDGSLDRLARSTLFPAPFKTGAHRNKNPSLMLSGLLLRC